ncbi:uncharacterized protein [Anoplolepis gracilipes]|uniref:uncharacterized protein n=1 Tax=Anoplolepis gracilipes TaxID=354296 RepID=UPI003BA0B413
MNLKNVVEICLSLAQSLCGKKFDKLLLGLTSDDEKNYRVFGKFAGECPNVVLAVLFRLGHFCNFRELLNITGEVIESRICFGEEESDASEHIEFLRLHFHRFLQNSNDSTRPIAIATVEGNRHPRINEDRIARLSLRRRRQADTSPEAGPSRRARIVLTPESPVIDLTEGDENDAEEPLSGEISSIDEMVIFSQLANYIAANEEVRNENLREGNEEAEIESGEMTEEEEEEEEEMREEEEEAKGEEEEEEENDINDVSMIEEVQIGG